jgi:hypothetical protein
MALNMSIDPLRLCDRLYPTTIMGKDKVSHQAGLDAVYAIYIFGKQSHLSVRVEPDCRTYVHEVSV